MRCVVHTGQLLHEGPNQFGFIVSKGDDVGLEAKRLVHERHNEVGSSALCQLLIPAFDRIPPNHHVTNDLLTLPVYPLFRGPRGRNGDRQQEYRTEDGDSNILRGRPRRIDAGSARGAYIVCGLVFSLR
jgi:hypothetical protein